MNDFTIGERVVTEGCRFGVIEELRPAEVIGVYRLWDTAVVRVKDRRETFATESLGRTSGCAAWTWKELGPLCVGGQFYSTIYGSKVQITGYTANEWLAVQRPGREECKMHRPWDLAKLSGCQTYDPKYGSFCVDDVVWIDGNPDRAARIAALGYDYPYIRRDGRQEVERSVDWELRKPPTTP